MSNVRVLTNLTEGETMFIIQWLAKTKSPVWTKQKFDKFFTPRTVDSNLILEVATRFTDEIKTLVARYESNYDDIPISTNRCQLLMLQELYEFCCEEKVVGVNSNGDNIEKADYPTARRCVETANKIVETEKNRIFREKEAGRRPGPLIDMQGEDSEEGGSQRFTMNIITGEE